MGKAIYLALMTAAVMLMGCQSGVLARPRAVAAATCTQDVIVAWNSVCDEYAFNPCPSNAGDPECTVTVGDLYFGAAFSLDCDQFMQAIQNELLTSRSPDPSISDALNSVLEDPAWYE